MRSRVAGATVAFALVLTGCSGADRPADDGAGASAAPVVPTYDASLAPSAAVLPLVPEAATALSVTDYDEVRDELGQGGLRTGDDVGTQDAFWAQAEQSTALLSDGLLRPVEARLRADFALSETDVAWEARFTGADGAPLGYVLRMRPETDMAAVQRAVDAGVGDLAGATVVAADQLVTSGAAADGSASWAADPDTVALVGLPAIGFYVERGCVSRRSDPTGLQELTQYSVQFESSLVTARLGPDRTDLFDRLELATGSESFTGAYEGGVADPLTGRLGFRMRAPAQAADLAVERRLAFAACGD